MNVENYTQKGVRAFYGVTKLDGTKDEEARCGLGYEDFCGFRAEAEASGETAGLAILRPAIEQRRCPYPARHCPAP
jgi:hypothetical protein